MDPVHAAVGTAAAALLLGLGACSPGGEAEPADSDAAGSWRVGAELPYASELVSFSPGQNAGFGQSDLPAVVLGPPVGGSEVAGSTHVVSLGLGGEIVLGFGARTIVDGPGPDFVVFENPFHAGGDPSKVFAEPAEVAVSSDGETWIAFPCDPAGDGAGQWPGCAGWHPRKDYVPEELVPLDPEKSGGDAFDLAALGLASARFVRIRDLGTAGDPPSAGFDLDAVGAAHLE